MLQHKAIIFCAPSGAGKTTIVNHLIQRIPELEFSISATTRQIRQGLEKDGRDYHFLSVAEFKRRMEAGDLYEWEEVYPGTYYGTLKSEVERIWQRGKHVIFDVDVVGGLNLKQAFGDRGLAIFVRVENVEVLKQRLRQRQTESEESLQERVKKATGEMAFAARFDYVLVNHELEKAVNEAERVVKDFIA